MTLPRFPLATRGVRIALTGLRWLPLLLLPTLALGARADIKITLDQKDGDKISDTTPLVAHVDSTDPVDKVEFRIDDTLRATSESIPYQYKWDTLADTEGKHPVSITAFDSNGKTARVTLTLEIDNELGQGADALAQKAQDALAAKDSDTARRYARRAIKADATNINAARALAGIYAGGQQYDQAIATLDKAKTLDTSADALNELAGYRIRRALIPDNAATLPAELQTVAGLRRKAADLSVAEATKKYAGVTTPEASESLGDAYVAAGRYKEAIAQYAKNALGDAAPLTSTNRMALAYVLDDHPKEAIDLLRPLQIAKKDDAASRAVFGLALLRQQKSQEAHDLVKADVADHVAASSLVASYANTMLGKRADATSEANDVVTLAPGAGEAYYALALATTKVNDSDAALARAIALSPFQSGPLLDYAARVSLQTRTDRYNQALDLTDVALKIEPQNVNARLMQAMLYLQTDKTSDAAALLEALRKQIGATPDVSLALAAYWRVKENNAYVQRFLDAARRADPTRFEVQDAPRPLEYILLVGRKLHYRGDFYLTPALLYPTK